MEIACLQVCDHESCTAAKSIANKTQAYVVTAQGEKTTENKMTYLSVRSWRDLIVLKVPSHSQDSQQHSNMF